MTLLMLRRKSFWLWFAFGMWHLSAAFLVLVFLEILNDPIFQDR